MHWLFPAACGFLLGVQVLATPQAESVFAPTFAEWNAACARLPSNRSIRGKLPRESLALPGFAALTQLVDAYYNSTTNGPVGNATNWVGTAPRRETFFDVSRTWFTPPEIPFEPFAQKLALPSADRVFLQGDLHGDIHSLLAVLANLQERQWLDGFRVVDRGLHLVFLGDYTDRGMYGMEVLYTLLRLKVANPDRVHLVRGNHEDVSLVARYGFLAEGKAKFGVSFEPAKLLRFYDFLPVVLYLGTGEDFVQLCHGGMEPGFNPTSLVNAVGDTRFQLIGTVRQETFLRENPGWLAKDAAKLEARRQFQDFVPGSPTTPGILGFMWNDFSIFGDDPSFVRNPDRAFVYGQPAVRELLRLQSGRARIHAVIRGHQHSSVLNPLMRRLVASRGIFRHWQEAKSPGLSDNSGVELSKQLETQSRRALPEGSVWTLNVAPDSVYGIGCNFGFATFGVLRLGAQFSDWCLDVETVNVADSP